jgi:hypothetical protein
MRMNWLTAAACAILAACSPWATTGEWEPVPGMARVESAADALSRVEAEWMAAQGTTVEFRVTSEGAFTASLDGQLLLASGNDLSLEATGTFGADSVSLHARGAGGRLTWGNQATSAESEMPPALREAIVIGLVRMGVLHNLARLVSGAPPDRTDGTVRSWVEVEDATWVPATDGAGRRGIHFGIVVSGQRVADATVWLDADGRLVGRDQVVRFPGGEMRVVERYVVRDGQ